MKIAVVGAGVSGLVVAHLLHKHHEITVFEAGDYAGGHTNTVRVDTADATHWVDTGFIVFNNRNYPRFERLLGRLGVPWQASSMSFSVADDRGDFEYSATTPNGLYAKRAHLVTPWFQRMVADVRRFQREARALLRSDEDPSLGRWLEELRFSRPFIDKLIVPQAAAVWSTDPRQMWTFPARFLAEFFDNHGMLGLRGRPQWRTVAGGSHRYVEALVAPWRDRLRLSAPVTAVHRHDDHVQVTPRGGEPERFDHVVVATHSDQALGLLADATDREHDVLGAIPYQPNEAVLHTDRRQLPR
ncbi:MAG TPA: FAD-dependent oxidoreductase, partial [Solirubrobacteraceae bacterium]